MANIAFMHTTGERLITREALRDLPGHFGGISGDADDAEIFEYFHGIIDRTASRNPGVVITIDLLLAPPSI
jgi:hypothetical protein